MLRCALHDPTFIRSVSSIAEFPAEETRPRSPSSAVRTPSPPSTAREPEGLQSCEFHARTHPPHINLSISASSFLWTCHGMVRASKMERKGFEKLIYDYLSESAKLMGVIVILDSGMGATDLDMEMFAFLRDMQMPHLAVANKVDKLSRSAAMARPGAHRRRRSSRLRSSRIPMSPRSGGETSSSGSRR